MTDNNKSQQETNKQEQKNEHEYEAPFTSLEDFDKFFFDEEAVLKL